MRGIQINPLIIGITGAVICVATALLMWFFLVSKTASDLATAQTNYEGVRQYNENPALLVTARQNLAKAQAQAATLMAQWSYIQRTKNPHIDVSDRFQGWEQWTSELEFDFAPRVEAFLKHTGVTPLTKIEAPPPPSDPNAVPTTLISMPLGTIQVFGSYNQILKHVAAWNRFDRIVLIDKLALDGYSPFMTGSYTATEYIFPLNGDKPGPPVPSTTGGASAVAPKPVNFESQSGFGGKTPPNTAARRRI